MASRLYYTVARIVALCLAAGAAYVAVYIPLMNLFFRKEPVGFLVILGLSITAAFKSAQLADRILPRSSSPDTGREDGL